MQRFIKRLVAEAEKTPLIYLAVMQALAIEGILQLGWALCLLSDVGDQEDEVSQACQRDET
jgi:hypothetical protein